MADATTLAPRAVEPDAIADPGRERFGIDRVALPSGRTVKVVDFGGPARAGTAEDQAPVRPPAGDDPAVGRTDGVRAIRRLLGPAVLVAALAPLVVLLASRAGGILDGTALGVYGLATLLVTTLVMYIAFGRYRDPSVGGAEPTAWPLVTMLVAVRDERDMIDRCVRSITSVRYPRLQVIVVDDGSTDGTRERLARIAAEDESVRLIVNETSLGKKRALTRAAAEAAGDILVFTDSDCVLAPDAVERVVRAFVNNPEIGAVSGHARALNADQSFVTKVQDTWYEGQFSVWKAAESVFGAVSCVSGPLAAFRREAIYNYFPAWANDSFLGQEFRFATDRQLTGYVLGQQQIGRRLKERYADSPFVTGEDHPARAWRIEYVKSAKVWTVVPPTMGRMLKQQVRWKKSFIRNLFFTGTFYWRRGLVPAFLYYAHVLFVLAMPLLATTHLLYLPLHGHFLLAGLYLSGVFLKGSVWGLAYKAENPRCDRWVYRPFMSVFTAVLFSTLVLYSALTLRRNVWVRG